MSKVVTIRIDDDRYTLLKALAKEDNRPLGNYIETATMKYIEEHQFVDAFEADEINSNKELQESIKNGIADYKGRKGSFV